MPIVVIHAYRYALHQTFDDDDDDDDGGRGTKED